MNFVDMLKMLPTMQEEQQKLSKRLQEKIFVGESGGGLVKVTKNGLGKIISVDIDISLLANEKKAFLEDLVVAAVNEAFVQVDKFAKEQAGLSFGIFEDILKKMKPN